MTTKEIGQLIKQIFASELDYQEIKDRADILLAKPSLTPEETFALEDYQKKLQHDRNVIKIWLDKLKIEGITSLNTVTRLQVRQTVLDELKQKDLEKINKLDERKRRVEEGLANNTIDLKTYNLTIEDINRIMPKLNKRSDILNNLKILTKTIWQP